MCGSGLPFSQSERKIKFCILAKDIMQYMKQFFSHKIFNQYQRQRKPKGNQEKITQRDRRHWV